MTSVRSRGRGRHVPGPHDQRRERWRTVLQWSPVAVIPAVVVGALIVVTSPSLERDNVSYATQACQDAVRQRLVDPDAAEFPSTSASGPGSWTVTGGVELTMAGEVLRTSYECAVEIDDDRGTVSVEVTRWGETAQ